MTGVGHEKDANSSPSLQLRRLKQLDELSLHLIPIGHLEPLGEPAADRIETRPEYRLRCLPLEAMLDLGQDKPMMLAFGPDSEVGAGEAGIGETSGVNADH